MVRKVPISEFKKITAIANIPVITNPTGYQTLIEKGLSSRGNSIFPTGIDMVRKIIAGKSNSNGDSLKA